jgi:hypothetical protein
MESSWYVDGRSVDSHGVTNIYPGGHGPIIYHDSCTQTAVVSSGGHRVDLPVDNSRLPEDAWSYGSLTVECESGGSTSWNEDEQSRD